MNLLKILTLLVSTTSVFSQCLSDTNNDNIVDVNDLLNILSSFGTNDSFSDINNDAIVDVNDLLIVLGSFGEVCNCSCCPDGALCLVADPPCCDDNICNLGDNCGDQIWYECGTSCPLICGEPQQLICNMMCNVGYQCPSNLWWDNIQHQCVDISGCESLPPDIAIGRPYIENKSITSNILYILNDWVYLNN